MSAIAELLDEVHATGAELVVLAGGLRLVGDRSRVTDELRARLRANKPELLKYLRPHPCTRCGRFWFREAGVVCYWCREAQVGA
jgi:TubC N-terminal docking domain